MASHITRDVEAKQAKHGHAWQIRIRVASMLVMFGCFIALVVMFPTAQAVQAIAGAVEDMGVWGPVIYGVFYVLAVVLFVPGFPITVGAGAIFGLLWGTITVSIASTLGAAAAFLIARYAARDKVKKKLRTSPKLRAVDRAVGEGGWKLVVLMRFSPAVPFNAQNYLYGLTAIRFWPCILASWLAMLPGTFMYVYTGYVARESLAAAITDQGGRPIYEWMYLIFGFILTVVVTVYITRKARRAIEESSTVDADTLESEQDTQDDQEGGAMSDNKTRGHMVTALLVLGALILAGCTGYAYTNKSRLQNLFGPPAVTMAEKHEEKPDGPTFDHADFDKLLKKHVDEAGMVDYEKLHKEPELLDKYIDALAEAPFDRLGRDERLALLINAYNAFTLRLILDFHPVDSIKDIPASKRWEDERWNIGGNVYSLNQIEHEQIRPNFKEPRIHFALVCAAIGCPPLRDEAYTAAKLEDQLHAQAVYVHTHDRWFQFESGKNVVKLTSLYDWYRGDFEQVAGTILQYAARYSESLKKALEAGKEIEVQFLDYDWSLNSRKGRA